VGGSYSHIDQKKSLAIAQQRLEQAERKLQKVQRWIPELEKQKHECRTALQGLANLIEINLPKKRTQIDQMIYSLESYMDVTVPEFDIPPAMAAYDGDEDMSKPAERKKEKSPETIPDLYKRLRDRNPLSNLTHEIRFTNSEINLFEIKDNDQALDVIAKYKIEDQKRGNNVTIIVDDSVNTSNFIFVEKVAVGPGDKTNIYIAPIESDHAATYSAYTITDYLQWNPTWHALFLLPVHWMILFQDGWITHIFNADETMIYTMRDNSM